MQVRTLLLTHLQCDNPAKLDLMLRELGREMFEVGEVILECIFDYSVNFDECIHCQIFG